MKVLIVDDQEINRMLPRAHLQRLGIAFGEAEDGASALRSLDADRFDVVLLDISMPGMSGLEVCRAIRADARFAGVRLVAYTAHAFQQTTDEIMAAGFDELLVKPIRRDTLLAALHWTPPS